MKLLVGLEENTQCDLKQYLKAVSNRWTGLLEWTTGMDFDLSFSFFFFQELTICIEELV